MTRELLARLVLDIEAKRPVVLATDLATGEASLVYPFEEGGGDGALRSAARDAATGDRSVRLERPSGALFLRVYNPPVRVVLVGAVHIAQALAPMAALAGYDVVVVDPRRAFATEERFRGVALLAEWPDEAFPKLRLDRRTAVVALSHDPKIDDPALAAALRSEAFYVGALGSKKTQAGRRGRLTALGFGDADLARLHAPIGLDIGAVSPGEIAISIASQLVGALRKPGAG